MRPAAGLMQVGWDGWNLQKQQGRTLRQRCGRRCCACRWSAACRGAPSRGPPVTWSPALSGLHGIGKCENCQQTVGPMSAADVQSPEKSVLRGTRSWRHAMGQMRIDCAVDASRSAHHLWWAYRTSSRRPCRWTCRERFAAARPRWCLHANVEPQDGDSRPKAA